MNLRELEQAPEYKVTVAIPTIDRIALLREALKSVGAQTYRNFEVVISDNSGVDRCAQELRELIKEFDDLEIHLFHQPKQISASEHAAFLSTVGSAPYWLYLPDDDLIRPYCLERFVTMFEAHPEAGLVFSDHNAVWEDGSFNDNTDANTKRWGRDVLREGLLPSGDLYGYALKQTIPLQASLYTREVLNQLDFATIHPRVPDFELLFRLAALEPEVRIAYVKDRLVDYRIHGAQFTHNEKTVLIHEANVKILKEHACRHRRFQGAYDRKLQDALVILSFSQAAAGNKRASNRSLYEALKLDPKSFKVISRAIAHQLPPTLLKQLQEVVSDRRGSSGWTRVKRIAQKVVS